MPKLAQAFGLNNAIIIQQIHFHLVNASENNDNYHFCEERWWIWNSYKEWEEQMPWWSTRTIRRIFSDLRDCGFVIARDDFGNNKFNHSLWYTLDYDLIDSEFLNKKIEAKTNRLKGDEIDKGVDKVSASVIRGMSISTYTETSSETNTRTHPKNDEIPQEKNSEPFTDADFKTPEPTPHRTAEDVRRGVEKATVKFFENAGKAPWLQWYSGKIYSRGEIEKEHLQHVGWLYEQITGTVPNSQEEWSRWRKIHETWYRESQFDFELLEDVLNEKCSGKYKTYNPTKITEAITAAVGENRKHEQEGGMRVVIPGQSSPGLKWQ